MNQFRRFEIPERVSASSYCLQITSLVWGTLSLRHHVAGRRRFVIIDGYNLMFAAGILPRHRITGDLERYRRQFLRQLNRLLDEKTARQTTVVFDAQNAPSDIQALVSRDTEPVRPDDFVQVIFASPGLDADSCIEDLLAVHSAPRQVLLVSSDHRLHRSASRRRAACVDSEIFWEELQSEPHSGSTGSRSKADDRNHPAKPKPELVSDVIQDFQDIDVSEIAKEVNEERKQHRSSSNRRSTSNRRSRPKDTE
jgi:predicted RNA-binding protein with PIN domain